MAFTAVPLAVHEVIAVAVHFADRRLQVVQIGFYLAIGGVFVAVLAPAVLPALQLVAELPGRHHVFPLDALRALGVFTHLIATAGEIRDALLALPVDAAAAVKTARRILVNLGRRRLGLRKIIDAVRLYGACGENRHKQNSAKHIPKQLKIGKAGRVTELAGSGKWRYLLVLTYKSFN